ncbi:MAG: hypothetical protein LBJ60_05600 [Tannerellaceae bacterium]|jgi:hypothetical protein|nr:hypothetical protein [Tannerellaceae bacterium]
MKPLILSFFSVILGYSFFFNKERESEQPVAPAMQENAVYDVHPALEQTDSMLILKNKIAFIAYPQ